MEKNNSGTPAINMGSKNPDYPQIIRWMGFPGQAHHGGKPVQWQRLRTKIEHPCQQHHAYICH